jgi:lipid II:glycine glycyltransferase (peptidoglycan interpeptide bridge formation enzyme)
MDRELEEIYPSVLATWAPIEYAANNGLKYFDFMGAGKPHQDYGVREFKSKFGGDLVNYGRYLRVNQKLYYQIGKIGLEILKRFN